MGWNNNPRLLEEDEGQLLRDSDPHRPCPGIRVLLLPWEGVERACYPHFDCVTYLTQRQALKLCLLIQQIRRQWQRGEHAAMTG